MSTDPQRQPCPTPHRIICRDYDRCCVVEGVVTLNPDGSFDEVEPMSPRPMSWEEMGRVLLDERAPVE